MKSYEKKTTDYDQACQVCGRCTPETIGRLTKNGWFVLCGDCSMPSHSTINDSQALELLTSPFVELNAWQVAELHALGYASGNQLALYGGLPKQYVNAFLIALIHAHDARACTEGSKVNPWACGADFVGFPDGRLDYVKH